MKWGLAVRNVTDAVDRPRVERKEQQSLTPDEVEALFAALDYERLRGMWKLAVYSGLRQGELIAFRWTDIDLQTGTLAVRQGQVQIGKRMIVSEPKTARSRRIIKLPADAVQALLDYRALAMKEGHAGKELVFVSEAGEMLTRNECRSSWERIRKATGKLKVRVHDLRHTNASLLLAAGVHAKVIFERLGHSTISLTLDTYSHVLPQPAG